MKRLTTFFSAVVWLSTSTASSQQNLWIVNPQGGPGVFFYQLRDAVDVAYSGDTILVQGGNHQRVDTRGKSLVIVADAGTTPTCEGLLVRGMSSNGYLFVRGIEFSGSGGEACLLEDSRGYFLFEDCTFEREINLLGRGLPAVLARNTISVVLAGCTIQGGDAAVSTTQTSETGGAGIRSTSSVIVLYESVIRGGSGGGTLSSMGNGGVGGEGVELVEGYLHASSSEIAGGRGGGGGYISHTNCGFGGDGGAGLRIIGGDPWADITGCNVLGGAGGPAGGFCSPGGAGMPIHSPLNLHQQILAPPHAFTIDSPIRASTGTMTFTFDGAPGESLLLLVSTSLGPFVPLRAAGVLVPGLPASLVKLGTIPASGQLVLQFPAPPIGTASSALTLYAQPAFLDPTSATLPVHVSTPSAVTLLP